MTGRGFIVVGALAGALGVAAGAFGAHALRNRVGAELLAIHQTAVQYHLAHALALVLVGVALSTGVAGRWASASGFAFCAGLVLFCGSLYAIVLSGQRFWGAVAPFGGLAFILGWLLLALAVWQAGRA